LTDKWPPESGEVFTTTIHQFKGLESPVVVLAEIMSSSAQDLEPLLYVGCSRARNHLAILASAELPEGIRDRLRVPTD
jgi:ATP-dependent exoDNAse (exonuclease V) beta subunit